jgi:hypothetical protein
MFKKSISILTAVLMIVAVTTAGVAALTPGTYAPPNDADGKIFFDNDYAYAGDSAQHSVASATYVDGYVTIVFNTFANDVPSYIYGTPGPVDYFDYYGEITVPETALDGTTELTLVGNYLDGTQTLTYYQGAEDKYIKIPFEVDLYLADPNDAPATPVFGPHSDNTYFVNVDPAETEE